jgi:hypothetical protein
MKGETSKRYEGQMKGMELKYRRRGEKVHTWKNKGQVEGRGMKIRNKLFSPRKCSCLEITMKLQGMMITLRSHIFVCV